MRTNDLHELPKVRDRFSYIYVEHVKIDQELKSISIHDTLGTTPVPVASICLLMLGPGTSITHAAVMTLVDNGCLIVWCGEEGVRFYASGTGTTRSSSNILQQSALLNDPDSHLRVVHKMYSIRFDETLNKNLTLQQIRGMEGVRVRDTYARWSKNTGVPWSGRAYKQQQWNNTDPINRALSAANACLYGVCHAAIVAAGYSPALGFIHTGKQLSFVYDVADLYKTSTTIPSAFQTVAEDTKQLESRVRKKCRDFFRKEQILKKIIKDIDYLMDVDATTDDDYDSNPAKPGSLWDPDTGTEIGGINYSELPMNAQNEVDTDGSDNT